MNLALFDLDYTLLAGDSDHAWGEFLVEEGVVDGKEYARKNDFYWQQYKAGTLDIREYLAFTLASISGKSDAELEPLHQRYGIKNRANDRGESLGITENACD